MSNFTFGELACGYDNGNVVKYTLNDSNAFFDTAYRILRKEDSNFVMCHKIMFNGKVQFIYNVEAYRNLYSLAGACPASQYINIVNTVIKEIKEIKAMGFVQLEAIDTDLSRIYIDSDNVTVKFICIPVSVERQSRYNETFENRMCESLANMIRISGYLNDRTLSGIYASCINGTLFGSAHNNKSSAVLKLRCVKYNIPEIVVSQNDFIIGKSTDADAVINVSTAISRKHCRIVTDGYSYKIEDLNSLNGTYINGMRINANRQYAIGNGDFIRLANVEFAVRREG